jgi:uncharacterized protein YbjT (DUF2867 family)
VILVLGATGTIGRPLVDALLADGHAVRAAVHHRPLHLAYVQSVALDLATGDGLADALSGVTEVFLLTGDMPDPQAAELRVVQQAKRHDVERIVKVSVMGAESEAFSFARLHRPVERAIEASGLRYTFLRPNAFMQNFLTHYHAEIMATGGFSLPCGEARVSHIDARDIARVAAAVFASESHDGTAYELTGPEAIGFREVAETLSTLVGRRIAYRPVSSAAYRDALLAAGVPPDDVQMLVEQHAYTAAGHNAAVTDACLAITGRCPIPFAAFADDHATSWRT